MSLATIAVLSCVGLFIGMCLLPEAGLWLARRNARRAAREPVDGSSEIVTAALFALLGLLTAFTFSGAFSRLDTRRQWIIEEANAISTAHQRLDLLPEGARTPLQDLMARYATSRAQVYRLLGDLPAAIAEHERSVEMQEEIWTRAVVGCRSSEFTSCAEVLLPALNVLSDISTRRLAAIETHQPPIIFATLFVLALMCAAFTGYRAAAIGELHRVNTIGLAAVISFIFYVIIDAEYPRFGLIRLDTANELLVRLADSMR